MDSFQLIQSEQLILNNDLRKENKALEIYLSHNTILLKALLKENSFYSHKHKFVFLMFSLIWEDNELLKTLLSLFQKNYEEELGFNLNLNLPTSLFYSKDIQKLYQKVFFECHKNEECYLFTEIISNSGHQIIFSEKCLISIIEHLNFEAIYNLIQLGILYCLDYSLGSKELGKLKKLNDKQLLTLMCKSNISTIFLYNFVNRYYKKKDSIKALIKAKANNIAQILLNDKKSDPLFIEKSLKIAAKYMNFGILYKNYTLFIIKEDISLELTKMMNYLIFNFENSISYIDFRIYLISAFSNHFSIEQSNHILVNLFFLISTPEVDKNILFFVSNPIKTLILILELSTKIKKKYIILEGLSTECNEFIESKCQLILSSIKSLRDLTCILEDKLFEDKNICEYIYTNKLLSLMKNPYFHLYVQNYWNCSSNNCFSPLTFSSSLKIISGDCLSNPCFEIHKYAFLNPEYLKGSYLDFVRNPSTKFIYHLLFDLVIGIVFIFYIFKLNGSVSNMKYYSKLLSDKNLNQVETFISFKTYLTSLAGIATQIIFVVDISGINLIGIIFPILYIWVKNLNYPIFTFKFVCNLVILAMTILITKEYFSTFKNIIEALNDDKIDYSLMERINKEIDKMTLGYFFEYLGLFFGFFYLKILFALKPIKILGPMITTIEKILTKVINFFILYFLILIAFASIGNIIFCFVGISDFESPGNSLLTLAGYTFGGYSLSNVNAIYQIDNPKKFYEFIPFSFLFLFLFNIFLINLLIGIITSIYSKNDENSKELHLIEIFKESKLLSYCENYSSLTSSSLQIIEITLPLYLGYFLLKTKYINSVILSIQYVFVLAFNLAVIFFVNTLLYPIAYIVGIVKFFRTLILAKNRSAKSVSGYLFFVIFYPFILVVFFVFNLFQSMFCFIFISLEKPSYDSARFVPSRRSFKNFYKEIKQLVEPKLSSDYRLIWGRKFEVSNLKSISSNNLLKKENDYSKIDLVSYLILLENFCAEDNKVNLNHIFSVISSQKLNFKLMKYCSYFKYKNLAEEWSNFIIFLHPKIPFIKLLENKKD